MKELAAATSEGWANSVCSPRLCDDGHSLNFYVSCPRRECSKEPLSYSFEERRMDMCYVIEINGARYDVELGAFSRLTGTVFHDYYMALAVLELIADENAEILCY